MTTQIQGDASLQLSWIPYYKATDIRVTHIIKEELEYLHKKVRLGIAGKGQDHTSGSLESMPCHLPELPELSERLIEFRHPGYEGNAEQQTLLRLYGFDYETGGIHHQTALTICGIIACNTWDGWLTDTRGGPRIGLDGDAVLDKDFYYFHVPPSANPTTSEGK